MHSHTQNKQYNSSIYILKFEIESIMTYKINIQTLNIHK